MLNLDSSHNFEVCHKHCDSILGTCQTYSALAIELYLLLASQAVLIPTVKPTCITWKQQGSVWRRSTAFSILSNFRHSLFQATSNIASNRQRCVPSRRSPAASRLCLDPAISNANCLTIVTYRLSKLCNLLWASLSRNTWSPKVRTFPQVSCCFAIVPRSCNFERKLPQYSHL